MAVGFKIILHLSFSVCWKASKASNDVNYDEL